PHATIEKTATSAAIRNIAAAPRSVPVLGVTTVPRQLLVGARVLACGAVLVPFDEPRLPGTSTDPEDRPQWRYCSDSCRQSAAPPDFLGSRELTGGPNKTNYPPGKFILVNPLPASDFLPCCVAIPSH